MVSSLEVESLLKDKDSEFKDKEKSNDAQNTASIGLKTISGMGSSNSNFNSLIQMSNKNKNNHINSNPISSQYAGVSQQQPRISPSNEHKFKITIPKQVCKESILSKTNPNTQSTNILSSNTNTHFILTNLRDPNNKDALNHLVDNKINVTNLNPTNPMMMKTINITNPATKTVGLSLDTKKTTNTTNSANIAQSANKDLLYNQTVKTLQSNYAYNMTETNINEKLHNHTPIQNVNSLSLVKRPTSKIITK